MNTPYPIIAGVMGLGAPELVAILVVLSVLAASIGLVVWLILRRTKKDDSNLVSPATHKKCPDCAEFVLIEARVCKHCGGKFNGENAIKA